MKNNNLSLLFYFLVQLSILSSQSAPSMSIAATNSSNSTISSGASTADGTINITFTSTVSTNNFAVGDVTVSGGSLSNFSGSGTTYTATFTPSGEGSVTLDVASGVYSDGSGNTNVKANDYALEFDGTNDYVDTGEDGGDFSGGISASFDILDNDTNAATYIRKYAIGGAAFGIYSNNSGKLGFFIRNTSGSGPENNDLNYSFVMESGIIYNFRGTTQPIKQKYG